MFGVRAVQALARHRPEALLRVLYLEDVKMQLGEVLKATAAHRKPYRLAEKEDLERLCGTAHHEGVIAVAKPFDLPLLRNFDEHLKNSRRLIALDDVTNPHNLGAVARSAAWFGYDTLLLRTDANTLNPGGDSCLAGGVFSVQCFRVRSFAPVLKYLTDNECDVYALVQHGAKSLTEVSSGSRTCLVWERADGAITRDGSGVSDESSH